MPFSRVGAIIARARQRFGSKAQIQEGDVRFEKVLTATSVSQKFSFTGDGSNARRQGEIYLSVTDLAILYGFRVSVQKRNTALAGNSANSPDYTYNDKTVFNTAATVTNVSEADALMAIWNGNMSIKAGTIEVENFMQLSRFYKSNQTQVSATTQAQLDQSGFIDIDIPMIISGQDTTILDFNQAAGADVAQIGGAVGTENVLALHFKALIIRNGAQPATWTQIKQALDEGGRLLL
jgi:hypothetical protein